MKATSQVNAGVCGFKAVIHATCEDGQFVTFDIATDCEKNKALAAALVTLGPVDAFSEISPQGDGSIVTTVRSHLKGCCAACVIPVAIFKSMQVASGLALPQELSIRITKE